MKDMNWCGISFRTCSLSSPYCTHFSYSTNCTMSLAHCLPLSSTSLTLSPSSSSISSKSSSPSPMIITEQGRKDRSTRSYFVRSISWITPSVKISSTWYQGFTLWFFTWIKNRSRTGANKVGPENLMLGRVCL